MRIAVLSDTHNHLRKEVLDEIQSCDAVIHAGDVTSQRILDEIHRNMKPTAPIYVARGNNDWDLRYLAWKQQFELAGKKFFLVHNVKDVPWNLEDCDIVIYGHTHRYAMEMRDGVLWLNPGSCGWARFGGGVSMCILTIRNGNCSVEKIDL